MTIIQAQNHFNNLLSEFLGKEEAIACSKLALENITGLHRNNFILYNEKNLDANQVKRLDEIILELKSGRPIQYILGEAWFYNSTFYVNDHVLIPRPETEELVELILKTHKQKKLRVLDIGTGSGCIALTLAMYNPEWEIFAIDISQNALDVAYRNAFAKKCKINFKIVDILNQYTANEFFERCGKFDIIISNPPYITFEEKKDLSFSVFNFEPHLALFAHENDSLIFYKKINAYAKQYLNTGGSIYYEINEYKGDEMLKQMNTDNFTDIDLIKDISGKNRIIKAVK